VLTANSRTILGAQGRLATSYPGHLHIGPRDSSEGSCKLVKRWQVSQQW